MKRIHPFVFRPHLALLIALGLGLSPFAGATILTGTGTPSDASALSAGTVIDFSSLANNSFHPSLSFSNVEMTGSGGRLHVLDQFSGQYNTAGNAVALTTGTPVQSVTFDFSAKVGAFGLNIGATDKPWRLSAYSASNVELGSVDIPLMPAPADNTGQWFGLAFDGIASAILVNLDYANTPAVNTADYILIDNFTFATRIPEPATWVLALAGLLGLKIRHQGKSRSTPLRF